MRPSFSFKISASLPGVKACWGTSEGFVIKTISEIEAEMDAALQAVFGAQINTSFHSVFGQLKRIFAESEALLWELLTNIYNAV